MILLLPDGKYGLALDDGSRIRIVKMTPDGPVTLQTIDGLTIERDDILRLEQQGTRLRVFQNEMQIGQDAHE